MKKFKSCGPETGEECKRNGGVFKKQLDFPFTFVARMYKKLTDPDT